MSSIDTTALNNVLNVFMFKMGFVVPHNGYLSSSLSQLETDLNSIVASVAEKDYEINQLQNDLGNAEDRISSLETAVSAYEDSKDGME